VKHFVKLASSCEKKTENKNHEFTKVGSQYEILYLSHKFYTLSSLSTQLIKLYFDTVTFGESILNNIFSDVDQTFFSLFFTSIFVQPKEI
jgi:hypothetical protein